MRWETGFRVANYAVIWAFCLALCPATGLTWADPGTWFVVVMATAMNVCGILGASSGRQGS